MIRRSVCYVSGVALLCLAGAASNACAQKVTLHLDPSQSEIHWTLGGVTHTVHGTFRLKGGVVTFDAKTGEAQGEILVDTASGESGNGTRDSKMRNEVLESDKYPQAFFHPTKISGALKPGGTQDMTAEGTFNIHGVDHPLTLSLKVQVDSGKAAVTTHFVVPYVAWGMKDPSVLMLRVSKHVDVDVIARGTVESTQ